MTGRVESVWEKRQLSVQRTLNSRAFWRPNTSQAQNQVLEEKPIQKSYQLLDQWARKTAANKKALEVLRIPWHLPFSFLSSLLLFCLANSSLGHHLPSKASPSSQGGCSISHILYSRLTALPGSRWYSHRHLQGSAVGTVLKKEKQSSTSLRYFPPHTLRFCYPPGTIVTTDLHSF